MKTSLLQDPELFLVSVMAVLNKLASLVSEFFLPLPLCSIRSSNLFLPICHRHLTPVFAGPGASLPHVTPFSMFTPDNISSCHKDTTNSDVRSVPCSPHLSCPEFSSEFQPLYSLCAESELAKPLSTTPANMCCRGDNSSVHWSNLSVFAFVQLVSLASLPAARVFSFSSAAVSPSLSAPIWQC